MTDELNKMGENSVEWPDTPENRFIRQTSCVRSAGWLAGGDRVNMSKPKTSAGTVKCEECGKEFHTESWAQYPHWLCVPCAKVRLDAPTEPGEIVWHCPEPV